MSDYNPFTEINSRLDRIESMLAELLARDGATTVPTKYVDMKGASVITGKSPNALRVQISLGNLKSFKKGTRHYFEREYLEQWIVNRK